MWLHADSRFRLVSGRSSLLLFLTVLLACCIGCAAPGPGASRPEVPLTDAQKITAAVDGMTRAMTDGNTFTLVDTLSDAYRPSRLQLKADLDEAMDTWFNYTFQLTYDRMNIQDDRAVAVVSWRLKRTRRSDSFRDERSGQTELQFARENGQWKLTQQVGDILFGK